MAMTSDITFVRRLIITIALIGLAALAWYLRALFLLAFGAVVVATVLKAIADPIEHRAHAPGWLALTAAILLIIAAAAGFSWFFGGAISAQIGGLIERLPQAWDSFENRLRETALGERVLAWVAEASPTGTGLLSRATRIVTTVGSGLAELLVVIIGGMYLAANSALYRRGVLKLLPARRRDAVGEAIDISGHALLLWLKGQLISMVVIGVCVGIGLWIIGVPSAFALGLLAGLLEFVPLIGPIVAAIPAVLLALTVGTDTALWTLLLFLIVEQAEGNVLQPMVQRYAVELPPALFLFALLAFSVMFGITGIIFAAPLTVVLYVLVKRLYVQDALKTPTDIPGEEKA